MSYTAVVTAKNPTIAKGELFAFRLPMHTTFRTSRGVVASAAGRPIVLLKLTCDDGTVGWGEASPVPTWSPETVPSVLGALTNHFLPAVRGLPVADLDGLHRAMDAAVAPLWGLSLPIARAGIDIAAHDALGRALGVPITTLLGARRLDRVQLSWTVIGASAQEVEGSLAQAKERGYRSANLKLGGTRGWDLELCRLVDDRLPDGFLWGDANGGFPPHEALARALELETAGLELLEQPLAPDRSRAGAALVPHLRIPLALDEPVTGPVPLFELIAARCLTAFTLKVTRTGGLLPLRRCADLAEAAGLPLVMSGLTDAGVAIAAAVQFAAAYGVERPCALNGPQLLDDDVLATPLARDGDMVSIPSHPGLGVEADEDKVRWLVKHAPV